MEAIKTNKITKEELEAVVKNQNAQQAYLSNIGSLEFQKSVLSAELSGLVQESEELKKSLEEAYGQVQISTHHDGPRGIGIDSAIRCQVHRQTFARAGSGVTSVRHERRNQFGFEQRFATEEP